MLKTVTDWRTIWVKEVVLSIRSSFPLFPSLLLAWLLRLLHVSVSPCRLELFKGSASSNIYTNKVSYTETQWYLSFSKVSSQPLIAISNQSWLYMPRLVAGRVSVYEGYILNLTSIYIFQETHPLKCYGRVNQYERECISSFVSNVFIFRKRRSKDRSRIWSYLQGMLYNTYRANQNIGLGERGISVFF